MRGSRLFPAFESFQDVRKRGGVKFGDHAIQDVVVVCFLRAAGDTKCGEVGGRIKSMGLVQSFERTANSRRGGYGMVRAQVPFFSL